MQRSPDKGAEGVQQQAAREVARNIPNARHGVPRADAMSLTMLSRNSSVCLPCWRWERAKTICLTGRHIRSAAAGDQYIATAAAFLRDRHACRDEWDLRCLDDKYP